MRRPLPFVVVLLFGTWLLVPVRGADKDPASVDLSKEEKTILDLTNEARAKEKLPPLKPNRVLAEVARAHSANMAKQGEMNHELDGKKPSDRVKEAGYQYSWMGENIAYSSQNAPEQIFKGWMNSPHHRENILSEHYDEIGIGIAHNAKGDYYYTQVFGRPRARPAP